MSLTWVFLMNLSVVGNCKNLNHDEVEEVMNFYVGFLIPGSLKRKINLTVIFDDDLLETQDAYGLILSQMNTDSSFTIIIKIYPRLSKRKILINMAHECIHIEHFVTGRFDVDGSGYYWDGEPLSWTDDTAYDTPDEIDARSREKGLYEHWKSYKMGLSRFCDTSQTN